MFVQSGQPRRVNDLEIFGIVVDRSQCGAPVGAFFFLASCSYPFPTSPAVAQSRIPKPLKATRKPTQKKTNAAKPYVAGSIDVPRGRPRPTCA